MTEIYLEGKPRIAWKFLNLNLGFIRFSTYNMLAVRFDVDLRH